MKREVQFRAGEEYLKANQDFCVCASWLLVLLLGFTFFLLGKAVVILLLSGELLVAAPRAQCSLPNAPRALLYRFSPPSPQWKQVEMSFSPLSSERRLLLLVQLLLPRRALGTLCLTRQRCRWGRGARERGNVL